VTDAARASEQRGAYSYFRTIQTRWMDNDAYGHVNNVTYYSYFDTIVNEHLIREGGLDIARDPAVGLVVETGCTFRKSLAFPDAIDAGMRVSRASATRR
jgi:acyl-CoA thioester hydrolase